MSDAVAFALSLIVKDNTIFRFMVIAFSVVLVLTPPTRNKRGLLFFAFRVAVLEAVMLLTTVILSLYISINELPWFMHITFDTLRNMALVIIYSLFFCKFRPVIKCAMSGSLFAAIHTCMNLSYSLGHLVDLITTQYTFSLVFIIYGFLLAFACFEAHHSLTKVVTLPKFGMILLISTNTLVFIATWTTLLLDTAILSLSIYSVIIYLILLILAFVCYLSTYFICIEHTETYKLKAENQMIRAGVEQIELSRQNLSDLRKIRHDLKNSYAYMYTLLQEEKYDKLSSVLEAFNPENLTPKFYVDCGNKDISAILTVESSKAHAKGIHLQPTLIVPPVLPFESGELFSILSNLIDNAIESNVRFGLTDDITVQIHLKEEYLYICVTNRLPKNTDRVAILQLKTKKEQPEEHGLGTQIVKRLAEKYNGYFLADIENDCFIAEVLLDMMYGKDVNAQ